MDNTLALVGLLLLSICNLINHIRIGALEKNVDDLKGFQDALYAVITDEEVANHDGDQT